MHPLATSPARPTDTDCDLLPLWTVDDLHDADLDVVLSDGLAEYATALRTGSASVARRM